MTPAWLQTLFEKWRSARGDRLAPAERPFTLAWPELLDAAGLRLVEDQNAAKRDLEQLVRQGRLKSVPHKYRRYIIERVQIPVEAEPWLQEIFKHRPAAERHIAALATAKEFENARHPRFPELWQRWCQHIHEEFRLGRNVQPLMWKSPEDVQELLNLTFHFTSIEWAENTPVRTASKHLALGSKDLSQWQARLENCLHSLFGREMTLESFGIQLSEPTVNVAGRLTLHFADGREPQHLQSMRGVITLSLLPDLEQAISISTPASRILLVENKKTTLPLLASKNAEGETLLIACSFPNRAVLRLLELLPSEITAYHFGDTDPAGFLILAKLRQLTGRQMAPFLMKHRPDVRAIPLTEYDQKLLSGLLENPWLQDIRSELETMAFTRDKGLFEQEAWGLPDVGGWPFYQAAPTMV